MYAKLKSGAANYDVIVPSDYMAAKMIAEGMLMPLNYDNIPNFQNIDEMIAEDARPITLSCPQLRRNADPTTSPISRISTRSTATRITTRKTPTPLPYMLCTTGIIYNTTMVDKAPTSWADLWDPRCGAIS